MITPTEIEALLDNLDLQNKIIVQTGKHSLESGQGFYVFDIYLNGILNRSVNLSRGFSSLMRDKNFIAAAPLVRLHLDSLLRLFAPQLIDFNVDDFAMQVMKGTSIRTIKDRENEKLTDTRLVKMLSEMEGFEWVKKVYNTGSTFVHYTDQTIFASMNKSEKERVVNFTIGQHDEFIPLNEKHGAAFWMNKITEGILIFTQSWIEQKKSYLANGG